jgi:diaminopimelate decarboxylase
MREMLLAQAHLDVPVIELEPGRNIVTDAVLLLASVVSIKNQPGIALYVNVDASVRIFRYPNCRTPPTPSLLSNRSKA